MTPRVSILIPVRNGARWLGEAIDSVLAQTFREFELIVVNDGSTDETPAILAEFSRNDARMRILHQEPSGEAAARNHGIALARAPLMAMLDADDRALPHRIDYQVRYLDAHPEIGVLGSWAKKIDEDGTSLGNLTPESEPEALIRRLTRMNPFIHSTIILRTELARRLNGYRIPFQEAVDYDLWLRAAEITKVANLRETLIEYRLHDANNSRLQSIRAAFSVRLAQRSAKARRETGHDPGDSLIDPPNWRSGKVSFCSEDFALYRLLDLADPAIATNANAAEENYSLLLNRITELSHAECKLAAKSLINCIKVSSYSKAARTGKIILGLVRRRPGMIWLLAAALRSS